LNKATPPASPSIEKEKVTEVAELKVSKAAGFLSSLFG